MIVGDYGRLMEAAKYGVTQALVNKAFRGAGGASAAASGAPTMVPLDVPGLDATDGIVFHRRPFQGLDRPFSVAALVCDVVVGKPFTADHRGLTAINVDRDFHASHDSVVLDHGTSQQSVVVFSPQQVLPRFLVHCHVDPTVSPCPTHPHKAVEYFLVESGNFACSQCVVLGPHRGARVITVEEACAEARQRIAETASEADEVGRDFAAAEEMAARNLDDLRSGKARQAALDAADDIRREADRRAQQLVADFDAEAKRRLSTAEESRDRIARSRRDFSRVADQLNAAARSANPSQVLRALNESTSTVDIEAWRTHGQEARALAAAANAQSPLRAAANRANAGGGGGGGRGQRAGSPFGAAAAGASTEPDLSSFRPPSSHPPTHRPQASAAALLASLGQAQGRVVQQHSSDQSNHSYGQQQQQQQQPRTSSIAPWMTSVPADPTVIRPTVGEGSLARSASARDGGELYQKFMNLKGHRFLDGANASSSTAAGVSGAAADRSSVAGRGGYHQDATTLPGSTGGGTPGLNRTPGAGGQPRGAPRGAGPAVSSSSSVTGQEQERKRAKEQMSQGWAAFRKGDTEQARRLWSEIYERNEHNATGARARAYMAEALTRDNEDAARWYERALRYDPGDVMTLFNYGVMLEGSDKKKEALSLFDTASRLGDTTAARRAETLRRQLGEGQ
jgi:tetratricopeptide (TPR) repeat protein